MNITFVLKFPDSTPSIEMILNRVRESTGLPNIEFRNHSLKHPNFTDYNFGIRHEANTVILSTTYNCMWYLLEATIWTLVKLGGKLDRDFELNPLAKEKWEQVRDIYQEKELFHFEWPDEEIDFSKPV